MPNPMLTDDVLKRGMSPRTNAGPGFGGPPPTWTGQSVPYSSDPAVQTATMTVGGTCWATAAMLTVLGVGAWFGWGQVTVIEATEFTARATAKISSPGWLIGPIILGFVLAIATTFRPTIARVTALPYALAEGVVLGLISHLYETETKGIALQAVIATCGVFAMMLLLYGLRILRATPRFVKGVIAATFGVCAIYLVDIVARLFGSGLGFLHDTSALSIGISFVIVAIAAFNLIIDFDFIERGASQQLPRSMEWYGAFGLVVTIVWLYLEILRLLSKLQRR